ncbi:MAG: hypothetical protein AAGD96_35060 [Chloroflexota bacterium]
MDVEKEIKRLKDEENEEIECPTVSKKKASRPKKAFNLWPLFPILAVIIAINLFTGNGESQNIWQYWWLIFFAKPFFFGWGKSWKTGSCKQSSEFV